MPRTAITIRKVEGTPGKVYYPLEKISYNDPEPKAGEIVVTLTATALNHRDLFVRQHLYPGTTFGVPLLSDACGIVSSTDSSPETKRLLHKRVIINPCFGWESRREGPEDPTGAKILGGTKLNPKGTLAETICVDCDEVEEVPDHLTDVEAAALPLTGLTAYRALFTKSSAAIPGQNVLVTGIGGGVALMVLMYASAIGVNVYVTSGSEDKLDKARKLGARGGVNYKTNGWEKELLGILPKHRPFIDAIIDGAGGDVVLTGTKLLKQGGVIVSYGMTIGPTLLYSMSAVLKNIEIRGTTMGSRKEFREMVQFVKDHRIRPVIYSVIDGLENLTAIDQLFEDMKKGSQFGKMVIRIGNTKNEKSSSVGKRQEHKLDDANL